MKHCRKFLLILILIPCLFLIGGCSLNEDEVYITKIEQTEVDKDNTIYTIYYSDGSTSTMTTKNPDEAYIVDIQPTETIGNSTTYTIIYSDNSTSIFTVTNGKDGVNGTNGKDGESVSIESIYDEYVKSHPGVTYDEFLKEFLFIDQTTQAKTVQDATNIAIQSAVTIWCEFPTSDYLGANKNTSIACGSGVIYKMDEDFSYIITNYHVVFMTDCDTDNKIAKNINIFQYGTSEQAYKVVEEGENGTTITVLDSDGYPEVAYGDGAIEATFVGGELTYDIAVIKVPTSELKKYNANVKAATVASDYEIGETAIAIGNPECEGFSATSGIVSVESEEISMTGADDLTKCNFRVMRIDTAVNGGNSGGGLFNINGELIGIVNAKAVSSDIDNIAYAIPYDNATAVVDNILHYYDGTNPTIIKKLYLGIGYTVKNGRAIYDAETNRTTLVDDLVIVEVNANSVGELIGFKAQDVVKSISINGTKHTITCAYQLPDLLLRIVEGDKIIFEVKREGETELRQLGITDANGVLNEYLKTVEEISQIENE